MRLYLIDDAVSPKTSLGNARRGKRIAIVRVTHRV